jgi:cobalt-zinc-cadmium efflux system protein
MPHDHHHHENHHHHDVHATMNKALIIGIILNTSFVLIETAAGLWNNSLALLTDAGHNLSDVASLVLIVIAGQLAKRKPNHKYTYGYGKTSILVALINASLLLIAVGAIGWEAVGRISTPNPVQGGVISIVAFVGIIINAATALLFMQDRKKDLNIRGAFLHMAGDALISFGVMVSGIIIIYTNWFWLDAVMSLIIIVVIVWSTWGLLKDSLRLSLDGVPAGINVQSIRDYLLTLKGVIGLHDLHIWAMSTNATALTAHIVMPEGTDDTFLHNVNDELHHRFNIDHTTIQIEKSTDVECEQKC